MHLASHMPPANRSDVQIFNGNSAANLGSWQMWRKPKGCTMVNIIALGSGAGGGPGAAAGAVSTSAGGGGGGNGGLTCVTIPSMFLPDLLYLSVGIGGAGGTTAAGVSGINTFVCLVPITSVNNVNQIVCYALGGGNTAIGTATSGGGAGSGATAGASGVGGAIATIANIPYAVRGTYTFIAGPAGIIGGTTVAGANSSVTVTGQCTLPACGGGGLPASGNGTNGGSGAASANVTAPRDTRAPATSVIYTQGGTGTATTGGDGSSGISWLLGDFFFTGGGGGASSSATGGNGGNGGDGGIGCGGGGGGGTLTGGTRSRGGNGGAGIVVITAW